MPISIHAPHTGRDNTVKRLVNLDYEFQSTRPIRGATSCPSFFRASTSDFNPRAPYGARRFVFQPSKLGMGISIHAPHTGRDDDAEEAHHLTLISIHAPHTGRDIRKSTLGQQPTISIHAPHTGRDVALARSSSEQKDFNPRAPYGARRWNR